MRRHRIFTSVRRGPATALAGGLLLLVLVPGCPKSSRRPVVAPTGPSAAAVVPIPATAECKKAQACAEAIVDSWFDRDYKKLFDLTSDSCMDKQGGDYTRFCRYVPIWRDRNKTNRDLVRSDIVVGEVMTDVPQAQAAQWFWWMCTEQREKDISAKTWPDWKAADVAFIHHTFRGTQCALVVVRDPDGNWRAMCPPGQLTIDMLHKGLKH